jgi:hypothetical protein
MLYKISMVILTKKLEENDNRDDMYIEKKK